MKYRTFPRYKVDRMNFEVSAANYDGDIKLLDVSFSGLKLAFNSAPEEFESLDIKIAFGKQDFQINGRYIWNKVDVKNGSHLYGLLTQIPDRQTFTRWLHFIKALHKLRLKQLAKVTEKS